MNKRYALGVAFIVLVALIWAGGSVLIQYIYDNLGFQSPFFLTFLCTSLFSLYIPVFAVLAKVGMVQNPPFEQPDEVELFKQPAEIVDSEAQESEPDNTVLFSHKRAITIAAIMCPLWFLANWSYYASLNMTSVSSSTVISTTSCLFTFFFSVLVSVEKFSWGKVVGVVACLIGTTMVALEDESTSRDSLMGDVIAIFSAVMYGCYTTALRRLVPNEEVLSMQLLFGYVGVLNTIMLGPIVIGMWAAGVLTLQGLTGVVAAWIIVGALFNNVLSDYLWARSIVLTSPTVATVGLSLTIPLAFLSDFLLGKGSTGYLAGFGAVFVIFGFVFVNTGIEPLLAVAERFGYVAGYARLENVK